MRVVDLTGKRFNRLFVVDRAENGANGCVRWNCVCDCGSRTIVAGGKLQTGRTKSCGCLRQELRYIEPGRAAANRVMVQYRIDARNRSLVFQLTPDDMLRLFSGDCVYCGQEPSLVQRGRGGNGDYLYNGIDRIDSATGYTLENCVSCCNMCNLSKRQHSTEEFLAWIDRVYEHQHRRETCFI